MRDPQESDRLERRWTECGGAAPNTLLLAVRQYHGAIYLGTDNYWADGPRPHAGIPRHVRDWAARL